MLYSNEKLGNMGKKGLQTYSDKLACRPIFFCCIFMYAAADIMSVQALLRLLEAVAKSIKHAMAMSTILATEIFQARCDAVLATSKVLLENSNHELRNAPVNSKTLKIIIKLRKLPRAILRPSSKGSWQLPQLLIQYNNNKQQKVTYSAPPAFKKPKQLAKLSRPQQTQSFRPKSHTQSYSSNRKEYAKRNGNQKQFPSSKQASSSTKY